MKLILFMFFAYLLEDFVVYSDISGYYWRDYYGEIPDDAFPGGIDINGGPIYIGQTLYGNYLVPGKIYGSSKKSSFQFGVENEVTQNVKILCAPHPEQLEWIPTDTNKIKILNNVHLILGGYQTGGTTYIGRARYKGEALVGKAIADSNDPNIAPGFYTTSIDRTKVHLPVYEVLSFNKNSQSVIDTHGCI